MNIHLVIHLDNFWVCCPALRLGTSAAFWKWGLLECMLFNQKFLSLPPTPGPAGPAAPAATRTTGPAAPAAPWPGLQRRRPRLHQA